MILVERNVCWWLWMRWKRSKELEGKYMRIKCEWSLVEGHVGKL